MTSSPEIATLRTLASGSAGHGDQVPPPFLSAVAVTMPGRDRPETDGGRPLQRRKALPDPGEGLPFRASVVWWS